MGLLIRKFSDLARQHRIFAFICTYAVFAAIIVSITATNILDDKQRAIENAKKSMAGLIGVIEQSLVATNGKIDVTLFNIAREIKNDPRLLYHYSLAEMQQHRDFIGKNSTIELFLYDHDGNSLLATNG